MGGPDFYRIQKTRSVSVEEIVVLGVIPPSESTSSSQS